MKTQKLGIEDIHMRLLNMAKTVDRICEQNHIPLFMVAGTMLGAIRHKGFIPWDDDMDFGVPYECFDKVASILEKELPSPYRCLSFENGNDNIEFHLKVEDHDTVAKDIRIDKPLKEQPGITIDIFPIVCCNEQAFDSIIPEIRRLYMLKRKIFIGSTKRQWYKIWIKRFIRLIVPFSSLSLNRKMSMLMQQIQPGAYMSIPVSPNYWNKRFKKEWFYPVRRFQFENVNFVGVHDYDAYLKTLYQNYQIIPPIEKQIVHMDDVYIR